jgi:hypothetical protein
MLYFYLFGKIFTSSQKKKLPPSVHDIFMIKEGAP